ncbi:two-component regulator propeller domain-containing protein [Reichenbachiella sp. MSK19-1]|uniref:hybrid sensor histidine kinase/response regulator transcription factor n=1 Tax=Reichenbachiella sp. MSK19-1 TaxID=1897631 RepID=UPI000E6D13A3|nr:two-component regulator propeller domain-containing protein [Reichenbachiella sp. MSK19-1]RJE72902.1 hypothetical protein BGP76_02830 [Reichenbachiella sp. MSK19-1]
MKSLVIGVVLVVGLMYVGYTQPQSIMTKNVYFEQLSMDLGLSQRSINCVMQDHEGYLWIGTWSGLIKYDGYTTKLFRADNSTPGKIKSNKIVRVFESRDSTLWVATRSGGLFRKDKVTDEFYQYTYQEGAKNCLSNQHVWDVVDDENGDLWIATENGLNHLNRKTGKFTAFYTDPADVNTLGNSFITRLMIDPKKRLWIATEYGVSVMETINHENPVFKRIEYLEDFGNNGLHNYVFDMGAVENAQGVNIYWVTKKGLKKYSQGKLQNYEVKRGVSSFNFFRSMALVKTNEPFLLLGSEMGLSVFDVKKNEYVRFFGDYDKEVNLSQNTVTALMMDNSGVLWAGTRKGLNKFDTYDNNIGLYRTKSFDPTNSIISGIRQLPNGQYWMSTLGSGLFQITMNGDQVMQIENYDILTEGEVDYTNYIQKLEVDHKGRLWVGTAGAGIYVVDKSGIDHSKHTINPYRHYGMHDESNAISDDYVMSLYPSNGGGMWAGTWNRGLNLITESGKVIVFREERLEHIVFASLFEDSEGYLWIGTRGNGLLRLKIEGDSIIDFQRYEYDESGGGLSNDFVNVIFQDVQQRLWVGTEDGLSLYDKENDVFVLMNERDSELPRDVISIMQDGNGQLWLAGYEGISVMDPGKEKMFVNHLDTQDRIQGGFFFNEVNLKTKSGALIFGGSNGFNVINPKNIYHNPHIPSVVIKEITASDVSLEPGKIFNGRVVLDKPISLTNEIVLHHDENTLSFEFASLSYANPAKNKYAYRLEGFDEDWKSTSANRRFVRYTNLHSGKYKFTVKASNDDGLWNEEGTAIHVVITPPWWKTQWAILLYVGIAMIFLYLFRRLILIRSGYEHELKFERLERENTVALNKSRLQFFTNISHEFRTPLTLILGIVEQMMNAGEGGLNVQKQLKLVSQNASRLQRLISQLLDFRKAEAGSLKLRVAEGNFYKFVKEVKLSFDSLAAQRGIDYSFEASSNVVNAYFDRDQFEKILFNLLSNAFKHCSGGQSIIIKLVEREEAISLSVIDHGEGISKEAVHKVFDRFYSGDQESGTGSGIGLALCKSLVELHHGQILVESEIGKGSTFEVLLPKGFEHFEKAELITNFKDSEHIDLYRDVVLEVPESEEVKQDTELPKTIKNVEDMKRILLVEDNPDVRSFLKSLFQYEYAVFEAANGQEGLEIAEEENPDLVISDVMMPVMDGITLCDKLKTNLSTSHIPVILLTARTSFIYNVEGLEKGADDYVTKPFHIEVIKLKVRNLIKSREESRLLVQDNKQLILEPKMVTVTSADEIFIQKCIETIEENMANSEYSVVEFGKEIGLSRMQLYRKLKALAGKSPNEFIRMMRIKRAAQLFEHGDYNVSEVTYQVGFSDPAYFRKCFKDQFGETPSNYIKTKKGGR